MKLLTLAPGKSALMGEHTVRATLVPKSEIISIERTALGSEMRYGIGSTPLDAPAAIALVYKLAKRVRTEGFKTLIIDLKQFAKLLGGERTAPQLLTEALIAANYEFTTYKKVPVAGFPTIETIYIENASASDARAIAEGEIIGAYTSHARDLANSSAKDMTPAHFAEAVSALARDSRAKVRVKILDRTELEELGMGLMLAVGGAAEVPPCVVVVEYMGGVKAADPIVIVGKGITYDTGGLSLKPSDSMLGMQRDMTGAATSLMAVLAAAKLGLKKNVVGIGMMAENAIGPKAYRPGDVLSSMAGISVENGNSDAEGRLVLADGIYYAGTTYEPKLLIDVATLTGAAHVAMGDHHSAIFTTDRKLEDKFRELGEKTANYVHPLPIRPSMHDSYIKSDLADIASTRMNGSRYGGATVGAIFLHQFAKAAKVAKHIHIDIAARMDAPAGSDLSGKATGEPVPLLVQAIREL